MVRSWINTTRAKGDGHVRLLRELISRQFRLQAVKVSQDFVTNKLMQSILPLPDAPDLNYLLGLINSRLMSWYFLNRSQIAQRDDFPKIVLKETRALPIRPINFSDPADVARHDRMLKLVEQMLELHKRQAAASHSPTMNSTNVRLTRPTARLTGWFTSCTD